MWQFLGDYLTKFWTYPFWINLSFLIMFLSGSLWFIGGKNFQHNTEKSQSVISVPASVIPGGNGGAGGAAKVGGSGIAIGGPGGKAGKYGRGGEGGSAEVQGDGIAAGGAGGSVDSNDLWSPPARSGYEVAMEATGQPIDPKMRQYGRGGMSSGYLSRYTIVEKIRSEYFEVQHKTPESALENVNAVPLDYVNQELAVMGVNWRARIVRGLDYEFYVP